MTHQKLIELLLAEGFNEGWTIEGETLTGWEHEQDPPAPLTRPTETTNEASTTDADTGTSAD
jgi:hypothetical protein